MKKIMFNDKYGLTQAVLEGRKTMTRRVINQQTEGWLRMQYNERYDDWHRRSPYMYIETLAIAQSYETLANNGYLDKMMDGPLSIKKEYAGAGYKNKMFVKAELMPHHIKITSIRVEHLQDISDENCLREGIYMDYDEHGGLYTTPYYDYPNNKHDGFDTPREAFAALIDKVSGKGTWESNPLVWVYEFELINSKK